MRIVLGLLVLLTAAGLKLSGLNVTALPRVGWFSSPQVQVLAAEWELVLGIWLLSGAFLFWSWLAAVATFTTFAIVSAYFGWIGVASCGCFGAIKASPWTAFGVDVGALVLLAVARPDFTPRSASKVRLVGIPLGAFSILALLTLAGSAIYGSPAAALAKLRGETLGLSTDYVDFGAALPGDVREALIEIHNWSDLSVRLVGGTSDCSCTTTTDLPLDIPPGEYRELTIRMRVPAVNPGAFARVAELLTDCESQRTIRFQIAGQIVAQSESGSREQQRHSFQP